MLNFLEQMFGIRPIIVLTNGLETKLWDDDYYMERPISSIYAKSAIQKEHSKYTQKPTLEHTTINENIAVRSHVRYIDRYREETAWYALTYEDTLPISEEDSPLNSPYSDEASAILPV